MFSKDSRVLIVDDMVVMRKIMLHALRNLGFTNVDQYKNGEEAWAALNAKKYDLVISDWNMPVCTGLELLKRVRSSEAYGNIPFMLVTAEADLSQVQEALSVGVDNYVVKPFSASTLESKLQQVYAKRNPKAAS